MNADSSFEVDEEATNAEIKKAFQKSLKVKANNKSILSSFIKQIA
jgi:ribosomal protein L23